MRCGKPVRGFPGPLLLFSETPQDEDCCEDGGKGECKPSAVGDFHERGGDVDPVETGDREPGKEDPIRTDAPDEHGS